MLTPAPTNQIVHLFMLKPLFLEPKYSFLFCVPLQVGDRSANHVSQLSETNTLFSLAKQDYMLDHVYRLPLIGMSAFNRDIDKAKLTNKLVEFLPVQWF